MARELPQPFDKQKVVAENRRARYDYFVEERFEAGIQLAGTEVKALRQGEGSIAESYATVTDEEVWLINSHIPEYSHGNRLNHEPRRPRKLLLKNREIAKLQGAISRQGLTLVPLSIYFNASGAGQDRAGAGAGQEGPRQARNGQGTRLETRATAPAEAQSLIGDVRSRLRRDCRMQLACGGRSRD